MAFDMSLVEEAQAWAEAHGAELGTETDPGQITGYALKWASIAEAAKGPTRFSPSAFGSGPIKTPLLWQHDREQPLGVVALTPDDIGLRMNGRIVASTRVGHDAIKLALAEALTGVSIGFNVIKSHLASGVRVVDLADLVECSLVTFPADKAARLDSVGGEPIYHAAAPFEYEALYDMPATAYTGTDNWRDELAAAEAELPGLMGQAPMPKPAQPARDWLSGRVLTPSQLSDRELNARAERFQRYLQRHPKARYMDTKQLTALVELEHEASGLMGNPVNVTQDRNELVVGHNGSAWTALQPVNWKGEPVESAPRWGSSW